MDRKLWEDIKLLDGHKAKAAKAAKGKKLAKLAKPANMKYTSLKKASKSLF